MLVLLVIFIITAPLMTRAISLDLPKSEAPTVSSSKDTLNISINARGDLFLDKKSITPADLRVTLEAAAARSKQTPIHLRAERDTRYESVIEVMSIANQLGLSQLAFVTDLSRK
jgi:biopolymer transport protein ExbD